MSYVTFGGPNTNEIQFILKSKRHFQDEMSYIKSMKAKSQQVIANFLFKMSFIKFQEDIAQFQEEKIVAWQYIHVEGLIFEVRILMHNNFRTKKTFRF